jgi:tetratricopeptide (TPR) repeat protein
MADNESSLLPSPSPEQRRVAAGQFERANQVIATGNYDYGIKLLLSCCHLDPANLIYRQALRRTEKTKYQNNLRGSWFAWLSTGPSKARVKAAKHARNWLTVLEQAETVFVRNPWDVSTQMDMAEAAEQLDLVDLAIWCAEQARQKEALNWSVARALARLYERRGNFSQAMALWALILKANPRDREAAGKAKDLAACETIVRGHYAEATGLQPPAPPAVPPAKASTPAADPPPSPAPATKASPDRLTREAATIRARLRTDPTIPNAYLQLANLYRRADQLDRARSVLEEGLGPTGKSFELVVELLDLEIEPFRRDLAVADQRLRDLPKDKDLWALRGQLAKEVNSRELELYRQKSDRYPTDMAARYELGVRLLCAGQVDEAIRELQITRADPRHQWRSLVQLGNCFLHRNNWRLARRNFEEALGGLPASEIAQRKEILFQLAQGCAEAGDLTAAVELAHELANVDFTYRDIGRLLDEWQSRLQANV